MHWHPEHDDGAYGVGGANGAHGANHANHANGTLGVYAGNGAYHEGGQTQGLPVVYHPYGDGAQAHDGYADPAAAYGWQEPAATGHGIAPGDAYGHPQGTYVDGHPAYGGGRNTYEGGHGRQGADREHEHLHGDEGNAYGAADDDRDAGHDDGSVFVDPSGRRGRLVRPVGLAFAAVCVVFIAVVIAGFFGSAPSGGPFPLPFVQEKNEEQKQSQDQEREQDGSTKATDEPGSTAGPTAAATPGESAAPSPSTSSSETETETEEPSTEEPSTEAPTTTASSTKTTPGLGNSGDRPGQGQAPTKGPR
ncbi:hypothetical protein HW130_26265 [Streptomyces sp. PKU-EA00015]|uniref:hypothetical protein n=1 Tax=Streptomyces sp. PKU-EA00015 TaxID=2748326 RepID=UPI0015A4BB31|nr:hypothetical protein [Streptomyces sp. PKU-EA00015]NWF29719.1 hypothetical protein [Streptomyces sp. PKU-EA00015]